MTMLTFRSNALPRGNLQFIPIQMMFILHSKSLLICVIYPLESQVIDWLNYWLNGFSALGTRVFIEGTGRIKFENPNEQSYLKNKQYYSKSFLYDRYYQKQNRTQTTDFKIQSLDLGIKPKIKSSREGASYFCVNVFVKNKIPISMTDSLSRKHSLSFLIQGSFTHLART